MQRKFQLAFHLPGSAGANLTIKWTAPSDCTLKHVSAVGSNGNDATIEVGDSTDANGYITAFDCGDSGTPAEKEALSDFDGALAGEQYPRIADGTIVAIAVDFDGSAGTAVDDLTIVLTFLEG